MKNYKATLFAPDGGSVNDFYDRNSIEAVWEELNDMGSRWIFYPIQFVTTDKTIVSAPDGLEFLKGKRIKTVRKYLKAQWKQKADKICEMLNEGYPIQCIF